MRADHRHERHGNDGYHHEPYEHHHTYDQHDRYDRYNDLTCRYDNGNNEYHRHYHGHCAKHLWHYRHEHHWCANRDDHYQR
jgi:hypothetical protein